MLRYWGWIWRGLLALLVFGFLDYYLPTHDTVRITEVMNRRQAVDGLSGLFYASPPAGTTQAADTARDIFYINSVRPNDRVRVYRNEDTGWIWPPFFKYDSANLNAQASNLRSTAEAPKWVSITSYGWRMPWVSAYPNALRIREVAGPDERRTNWASLIILGVMLVLLATLWRMWAQFRERSVDPALAGASDRWDRLDAQADAARGRVRRWWQGWGRK